MIAAAMQPERASGMSGTAIVVILAAARLALHLVTGGGYGFHRDELATIDDARHLAWGFVAYPPLTPFVARAGLELFGASLSGIRLFAALAQAAAMVLAGLMARELGATRGGQALAAVAAGIAPVAMLFGVLFQYVVFDHLWWVLAATLTIRLLRTGDPRWWLAIGAVIGLGMMTKYTMGVLALGIAAGVILTPARRHLRSRWLWAGAVLSVAIFIPNLAWQVRNDFVSLEFLARIHSRDVEIGRTDGFLVEQLFIPTNLLTVPLWAAGLWFFFASPRGARWRMVGWMFVVPFAVFLVMEGRSYYMAPAYPMLFAGGAVMWDAWLAAMRSGRARVARAATFAVAGAGAAVSVALMLPVAPIGSPHWNLVLEVHQEFAEEIGWEELVATVADVHRALPDDEKRTAGIFAGNYGEAGAVNLYGPRYGLPQAISGVNSYWARGFGDPPPRTLIVLGVPLERAARLFERCEVSARVTNRWNVENEETRFHPDVLVCRGLREPWHQVWPRVRSFG